MEMRNRITIAFLMWLVVFWWSWVDGFGIGKVEFASLTFSGGCS